jgi:hypothetical protein
MVTGVSGVSRLSSSRSNASSEDLYSWTGSYESCQLETARAQELARPMKVLIKEIEKTSTISRKRKREFFENYESRVKISNCTAVEDESELCATHATSNFEFATDKNINVEGLTEKDVTTVISDIQFSRSADIKFAEKINLPPDFTAADDNLHNMHQKCEKETLSSTVKTELFNEGGDSHIDNTLSSTDSSLNNTFKAFSVNEVDNKIQMEEPCVSSDIKAIEYIDCINDTRNANIYINEVEFSIVDDTKKLDNNNLERYSNDGSNANNINIENNNDEHCTNDSISESSNVNDSNNRDNEEMINYINEVEFFVDNNSTCDNEIVKQNDEHDILILSRDKIMEKNPDKEDVKHDFEKIDLLSQTDSCKETKIDKNADGKQGESQLENNAYDNSRPVDSDTIEMNPLDVSFNVISKIRKMIYTLDQAFDDIDTTIKANEQSNNSMENINTKYSDEYGNLWLSVKKDDINSLNDDAEQLPKIIPNSLNLTYFELEKHSEDLSPASTTRESFFSDDDLVMKRITRRDSIAEVASSINADIKPSNKVTVDMLAETENSIKYHLDSQNMSLIYSITPTNDISDSSKNTTIEDILEDMNDDCVNEENDIDNIELIRMNSLNNADRKDVINMNKTIELSETSFVSNISNQGSDLLELPTHTYLDLQKSSDEIFQKNMSTSVNQIINELNDAELFVNAANFVDEILYDVACLNLPRDISKYSKVELRNFIQEKILALNLTKKIAKELVGNLQCYDADRSTNSKVSNIEESSQVESVDHSVYVIREIIHHLIDKENLGKCDFKYKKTITDKKAKESINIELKSLKDDYDDADEINIKCSTPKFSLSPSRSKSNSLSEDDAVLHADDNNESIPALEKVTTLTLEEQASDLPVSSNSSPSTESQNFAEQEVTSESTDNDTKSDNSKEKQICVAEEIVSKQPTFNTDGKSDIAFNSSMDRLHGQVDESNRLNEVSNKISYCLIECASERDAYIESSSGDLMNYEISSDSSESNTYNQIDNVKLPDVKSNRISYCVIECASERNVHRDISTIKCESKGDIETDSNETITDFMEKYMDCEDEINQLWRLNEEKFEEMYAAERLDDDIINIDEDILDCKENIGVPEVSNIPIMPSDIREEPTSDIYNDNNKIKTEEEGETSEEYYKNSDAFENSPANDESYLSLINDKLESKNPEDATSSNNTSVKSKNFFLNLSPIIETPESNSSCDEFNDNTSDMKTPEFHSCQNSISLKSGDELDTANSTFTVFLDPGSDSDKAYSADLSTNDLSSDGSIVGCTTGYFGDERKANNNYCDVTENFHAASSTASTNNNYDIATLEYMTYSYETKEFIQMEMACNNISEFIDLT